MALYKSKIFIGRGIEQNIYVSASSKQNAIAKFKDFVTQSSLMTKEKYISDFENKLERIADDIDIITI